MSTGYDAAQILHSSHDLCCSAGGLLAPLSKIASDGSVKAAQRAEGVTAALAIALIAGADVKNSKGLESFWTILSAPNAALLSVATLAKLPAAEAACAAELAEVLLLQVSHVMQFFGSRQIPVLRSQVRFYYVVCGRSVLEVMSPFGWSAAWGPYWAGDDTELCSLVDGGAGTL